MCKSILITGAGSGIGLATALVLAERGYHIYAAVLDAEQEPVVREAAERHGVGVDVLLLDVTDTASIQTAVDRIVNSGDPIYGLVNSAGLGMRGFFEDVSEEELRRVYEVNVFGTMAVTKAVLPYMRLAKQGRIVLLTSAGGRIATMSISAYASGKFAIEGFGESLALEVAPFNIRVSLIEPGLVLTPHFTQHRGRAQAATHPESPYRAWFLQHEQIVDTILRKGKLKPADVAHVVHRALSARRPRLRYPVGRGARFIIGLRRLLPERMFEKLYFDRVIQMVTHPKRSAQRLNDLSLPGGSPYDYLGLSSDGVNRSSHARNTIGTS